MYKRELTRQNNLNELRKVNDYLARLSVPIPQA